MRPLRLVRLLVGLETEVEPVPPEWEEMLLDPFDGVHEEGIRLLEFVLGHQDLCLEPDNFKFLNLEELLVPLPLLLVVFDEALDGLDCSFVVFLVKEVVVELFLVGEEVLVHVEVLHVLDGELGGEDSEVPLLLDESELVPLDVGVGNQQFLGPHVGVDVLAVVVVWVVDHVLQQSHHLGLHELVYCDPLAQDSLPGRQVLVLFGHPLPPAIDLGVD